MQRPGALVAVVGGEGGVQIDVDAAGLGERRRRGLRGPSLGQAWFGLLLVMAYGVGLALTLTAAGVAVVRLGGGASRLLRRRPRWASGPLAGPVRRAAPLGSAFVVVALGAGLVFRGAASALG